MMTMMITVTTIDGNDEDGDNIGVAGRSGGLGGRRVM